MASRAPSKAAAALKASKAAAPAAPETDTAIQAGMGATGADETSQNDAPEAEAPVPQAEISTLDHLIDAAKAADAKFASQHAREDEQAFYRRLMLVCGNMPDALYGSLPEPAQVWYNAAADAISEGKPIPTCEGYVGPVAAQPKAKADAPAGDKPKRAGNTDALKAYQEKVRAEKAAAIARGEVPAKPVRAAAAPKEPRAEGLVSKLRKALLAQPTMTVDDLVAFGKTAGLDVKASTAAAVRTDTLATYNILREMGALK